MTRKLSFKFLATFFLSVAFILPQLLFGQASVTYSPPAYYLNGQAITNLSPTQSNITVSGDLFGTVTNFAGTGASGGTNTSTATTSTFNKPRGIVKDAHGNYYVAEYAGKRIRKITSAGVVSTVYTFTSFEPRDLAINTSNGDLYVVINSHRIIKLPNTNAANYSTQAPTYTYTNDATNVIAGSSSSGYTNATGINARFNDPWGIAISPDNSYLIVSDYGNGRLRKLTLSNNVVTDFVSNALSGPTDVYIVNESLMYVSLYSADKIAKIVINAGVATVSDFVGGSYQGGRFDGSSTQGYVDNPHQITGDALGNIYVIEAFNHKVRKITSDGKVSTVAGSLWDNAYSGSTNGVGVNTRFNAPTGIFFDVDGGFLLVADTDNHRIRKVQLEGYEIIPAPATGLNFSVTTGVLSGTPTQATLANQYIQTFNSSSLGTVNGSNVSLNDDAAVHGDILYLTTRQGSKKGGITIPATGINSNLLDVEFDLITTHTGGADGLSYSFAPDASATATSPAAEIGTGTKLSISFATYASVSEGIRLIYNPTNISSNSTTINSQLLAFSSNASWIGKKVKVKIYVDADAKLTLTVDGVAIFTAVQLPSDYITANKATWKHVVKARTGASYDIHAIDNLSILQGYGTTTHKVITRDNALYQEVSLAVNVPVLPTLSTTSVSSITTSGAAVNFAVNTLGSGSISGSGIVWGSSTAPTLSSNLGSAASGSTSTGNLSSNITGLDDQTDYYVRSYVTTSLGHTVYGNELSFTTLLAVPEIAYNQTNSFVTGVAITPLTLTNTGGVVVAGNTGTVSTIAGSGVDGSVDGMSISAQFKSPEHIVIDSQGNKFISEGWGHRIRKITPDGTVSTFAGSTQGDVLGTGTAAKFSYPTNMAIDVNDNIFVVDYSNSKIKKITPSGVVTTFASGLYTPAGMVFDAAGNLVVVDRQAHVIRKYTPQGVASVFVGSGTSGTNNGTGAAAQFNYPSDIVKDENDNFYVTEYNRIRKITAQGVVTTLAGGTTYGNANGTGTAAGFGYINGLAISPDGDLYVSDGSRIRKITPAGVVTTYVGSSWGYLDGAIDGALFKTPYGLQFDQDGNLIVVDRNDYRIRKIAPPSIGSFTVSPTLPAGLTLDANGSISGTPLVASAATNYTVTATNSAGSDTYTLSIEVLTTPSVVTNILSNPTSNSVTAGGNVLNDGNASLQAVGICWSTSPMPTINNTIVAATSVAIGDFSVTVSGLSANQTYYLRAFATNSVGTSYGAQVVYNTTTLALPDISYAASNVLDLQTAATIAVTNNGGAVPTSNSPIIPIIAGSTSGNVDATGENAKFGYLTGIDMDNDGNLIVADFNNNQIKKVTPAGVVTTIAGTGVSGFADGSAANATFNHPYDVAVDVAGNIYVSDMYNHRLRKITPAGVVSTVAGSSAGNVNGTGTAAKFYYPRGIDLDENGNIFIADEYNYSIRKVTPQGVVTTVAGSDFGFQDGTGSAAKFKNPTDLCLDPSGNIYVADYYNNRIRKVTQAGVVTTYAGNGSLGTTNGASNAASFNFPHGIKVDDFGFVYVTELWHDAIRKISPTGVVSSITALSISSLPTAANGMHNPRSMTLDAIGNIYFTEGLNTNPKVKKMLPLNTGSWSVSPALPAGLTLGTNGNIFGTPLVTSAATDYTVTATNSTGSDTYTLNIAVTGPSNDQIDLTATTSNITEQTVAVSATLSTGGSVVVLQNDPYHLVSYGSPANLGTIYQITLTGQIASGTVWGTNNIYTHDSRISQAAVHAGILANGVTGTVYVQLTPGLPSYGASTANGVTTYTWPSWPYTYSFVNAPSAPNTLPVTAKGFVYATFTTPVLGAQNVQSVAVTTGTTTYNTTLSGLTPGQTYYIRAYATNTSGTYYSDEQVITTADITYANVNVTYGASNATIQVPSGVGTSSITYSSSNSGVVSVSGPIMTFGNVGDAVITATQAAYGSYGGITNTFNVTVGKANQSLSMQLNNGSNTALPQTQALSNLTGSNFMQIAVSSKYMQGATLSSTSLEPTLTMNVSSPTTAVLTDLTTPFLYTFGNVANSQTNATVTFTLTHPGNTNFNPATITHTMDITNDIGVITFNQPAALTYPVSLGVDLTGYATSTSAAPIVYSVVSGPGSISNNALTVTGAGTIVLQAAQPSANTIPVNQNLVINKGVPVYTFANMTKTYGDADFTPSYVSSSDGTITFSSSISNVATTGGSVIDVLNAGTTTITLSQTEGTNYVAAAATATLTVNKASQTINYTSVSPITTYDFYFNPIVLPTESSTGLPLTYSTAAFPGFTYGSQGPIGSISANLLSFDETAFINGNYTGSVMLTISQAGNDNYLAAEVTENINVTRIPSVITATDLSTVTAAQIGGIVPYSASTNANFPGHSYPISVMSSNSNVATYNASTGMLEIVGTGTTWITASHYGDAYYTTGMHTQVLSISSLSIPTISATTQYPCAGQVLQDLNVQTNMSLAILKWYDAATGGNEMLSSELVSNTTVWVSQFVNGQESSRSAITMVVTDISNSTLSTISGSSTAIAGTPLVLSVTQLNGATSYVWDLPAGLTIASTSNNGATVSITVSNAYTTGIIKVKAINACAETAWQTKTVSAPGQAGIAITTTQGGAPVICGGTNGVSFSATAASGATYSWTLPTGLTFASGYDGDEQTTQVNFAAGYVGGAISCTRTTATGTNTASYTVGGVATPSSISGPTALCDLTTATYFVTNVSGMSYQWQLPTGMTGTSTTNSITATWTGTVSGTVQVRATGTCGTSAWRTLSVGSIAQPSGITGPTIICGAATYTITGNTMTQVSQTTLNYSVTNVAGMNYAWTVPTGMTITSGGNTNAIVVQVDPTNFTSGQVSVTATNQANNTCVSAARTLNVSKAVATITGPTALCGVTTATYSVPSGAGSAFAWTLPSWMSPATGYTLTSNPINVDIASGASTQTLSVVITTACGNVTVSQSVGCGLFTQLSASSCGATLPSIGWGISANNVAAATAYQFTVTAPNGTDYTITSADRWITLGEASSMPLLYGDDYAIKVRVQLDGSYGGYGASCSVYTPSLPTTTLSTASCGTTLPSIGWGISANNIAAATKYRFNITVSGNTTPYVVESVDRWITLSEATNMPLLYGTIYSMTVEVESGTGNWGAPGAVCTVTTPSLPTTTLSTSSCGATLPSLGWGISATNVAAATKYRFNISIPTQGATVYQVESVDRWITLSEATGMPLLYATAYEITVEVESGSGNWSAAGDACTVTTPSLPVTTLSATSCGATLPSIGWGISANNIAAATKYRFNITAPGNTTPFVVESVDRWITLSEATTMPLLYAATYGITVEVEYGTGNWGAAGAPCNVLTPAIPSIDLSTSSCGTTLPSLGWGISATNVAAATQYEFQIINQTLGQAQTEYYVISPDRWITLSEGMTINNVPLVPQNNQEYVIRVRVYSGTAHGEYSEGGCILYTPVSQGMIVQDQEPQLHEESVEGLGVDENASLNGIELTQFELENKAWSATATSNPFEHSFKVNLNGAEAIERNAMFTATLTDMSGKVYTTQTLSKEALTEEYFGQDLAPGMYMLTLRQGEELRVLRVVKR